MTNDSAPQVKLVLCEHEGIGRITVELESFFEFSFWLAEELQDLIERNKQFALPEKPRRSANLRRCDR